MTFEGIAAVQARIQEIQGSVGGIGSPAAGTAATSTETDADFASLLSNAMNTQGGAGIGGTGSTTTTDSLLSGLVSNLTGTGTTGAQTTPDITSLISNLTGGAPAPNATAMQFVDIALAQQGKPYVWGSTVTATDANPASFDCSELTKWAAARSGVTIPDGAAHQYVWLKEQGATMTVEQALQTPGALLFHFAEEPQPGLGGEPPVAHVAISLGNGKTIEARGRDYGVGIFDAKDRFEYAGMAPGMV